MPARSAKESEIQEIAELQQIVFRPNEPDSVGRYLSYAQEDPAYTLDHSRVIEADGRIVAHLRIWDRSLVMGNVVLEAAGIGSLCVHPNYRKQGLARALMQDSERYFCEAGYDLGLLFTIIGTPFYDALNWVSIDLPEFAFDKITVSRQSFDMWSLTVARDLASVMQIYAADGLSHRGSVVRDQDYWTSGPARIRSVFPSWGVFRGDNLVAYVNFTEDENEVWIKEACALPGEDIAYADLVSLILDRCEGRRLGGSLPRDHAFVRTLETIAHQKATWRTYNDMMVKGINWISLRDKLDIDITHKPKPDEETAFWKRAFGDKPFYWDTDIF